MRLSRQLFNFTFQLLTMGSAIVLAAALFGALALFATACEAAWWLFGLPSRLLTQRGLPRGKR